jgi:hypothetical protein
MAGPHRQVERAAQLGGRFGAREHRAAQLALSLGEMTDLVVRVVGDAQPPASHMRAYRTGRVDWTTSERDIKRVPDLRALRLDGAGRVRRLSHAVSYPRSRSLSLHGALGSVPRAPGCAPAAERSRGSPRCSARGARPLAAWWWTPGPPLAISDSSDSTRRPAPPLSSWSATFPPEGAAGCARRSRALRGGSALENALDVRRHRTDGRPGRPFRPPP